MNGTKIRINKDNYVACQNHWELMCQDIAKKYWGLDFDLPVYLNSKLRAYGVCRFKKIKDSDGKVARRKPECIEVSQEAFEKFDYGRMLDLLKHEVCHWACMVQGKPFGDKTIHFENELRRIGSTTSGVDMHQQNYREVSLKLSDKIINKTKPERIEQGNFSHIRIYYIRRKGSDFFRLINGEWQQREPRGTWSGYQKYEYYYFYTFLFNGESFTAGIGFCEGKWQMRNTEHGIYKTSDYDDKLFLDRKTTMQLRKTVIEHIHKLNEKLSIELP